MEVFFDIAGSPSGRATAGNGSRLSAFGICSGLPLPGSIVGKRTAQRSFRTGYPCNGGEITKQSQFFCKKPNESASVSKKQTQPNPIWQRFQGSVFKKIRATSRPIKSNRIQCAFAKGYGAAIQIRVNQGESNQIRPNQTKKTMSTLMKVLPDGHNPTESD